MESVNVDVDGVVVFDVVGDVRRRRKVVDVFVLEMQVLGDLVICTSW
jgi:hypothetical protein